MQRAKHSIRPCRSQSGWLRRGLAGLFIAGFNLTGMAQAALPPEQLTQIQEAFGSRIETFMILGGDYTATAGTYRFHGENDASIDVAKAGGSGGIRQVQPLGDTGLKWAPALACSFGITSAKNQFRVGPLAGNAMQYRMWAAQAGVGVQLQITDRLWIIPMINGIYGRIENEFRANTPVGRALEGPAVAAGLINWQVSTWSTDPSIELHYAWQQGRIGWEYTSRYNYFHTVDRDSTSPLVKVDGRSSTWYNKLDLDVPTGRQVWGHDLHTGGYVSRSDLFGDIRDGFISDHVYTVSGRLVLTDVGHILRFRVRWLGMAAAYFWGTDVDGWSLGLTMRLAL